MPDSKVTFGYSQYSAFNDLESTSMSNDTDRTYVKLQVCGNDGSPDIQKYVDLGPDIMPSNSVNKK